MGFLNNKWMRAAVPALLIHCSIGTVYCWSTFKGAIAQQIGMSPFAVGWAFSLAIFFLGMSAAVAGRMVEKNIHFSSLLACICFTVGMLGTGLVIQFATGIAALIGIYIFYGCIMGIGLGVGYLTPVKTLMLWFSDQKGLATGLSIMGFGLAKAIATPIMEAIQNSMGISSMFYILGGVYFCMMMLGHFLIRKPAGYVEKDSRASGFRTLSMFRNKTFVGIWLMFYINIHCGLALISYEKQILGTVFAGSLALAAIVSIVPSCTALLNAFGRIGFSTLSDHMRDRNTIYKIIFTMSICATLLALCTFSISNGPKGLIFGVIAVALLLTVNAGYGGGFSTLPALLSSRYGMDNVSKIHGLALSAWAVAGLTGNNMSALILSATNNTYDYILIATVLAYGAALAICVLVVGKQKAEAGAASAVPSKAEAHN